MEDNLDDLFSRSSYCSECQVGIPRMRSATYYAWIDDEIIAVPDFPCWVCDVCGRREWDAKAMLNLNLLLAPNAGEITPKKRTISAGRGERRAKPRRRAER